MPINTQIIPPSDLILNTDGSLYHLQLTAATFAPTIITVGDPCRVATVSQYFDKVYFKHQHREICTHIGSIGSKNIMVISTGMGTDNVDIVLNELDALANIDLSQRIVKKDFTQLTFVRIGTSGALNAQVPLNSFVVSSHAIGLDSLMNFYPNMPLNATEDIIKAALMPYALLKNGYVAGGCTELISTTPDSCMRGITVTCPGFYAPQGRNLRVGSVKPSALDILSGLALPNGLLCTNFEMETAGIYALAKQMGHRAVSFNAILAQRVEQKFSTQADVLIKNLIELVLDWIAGCV